MILGEGAGQDNDERQQCSGKEGGNGEGRFGQWEAPILSFATFLALRLKSASRQPQGVHERRDRDILKDRSMNPNL